MGEKATLQGLAIVESLRNEIAHAEIITNLGGGSMKSQMKKADRSGAKYALIMGENELEQDIVILKDLRENGAQEEIARTELATFLRAKLAER